jgi:hypothetical protein
MAERLAEDTPALSKLTAAARIGTTEQELQSNSNQDSQGVGWKIRPVKNAPEH